MGLKDTFQKAAVTAVKAFGDVAVSTTYVSVINSDYDPSTDTISIKGTTSTITEMIFSDFEKKEIDGEKILDSDEQAFIPKLNLTPVPKVGDRIHKSATDQWQVMDQKGDAAEALWILHIRQVGIKTIVPE